MGIYHKLPHVVGGSFGVPHAETHAVVIPRRFAFDRRGAREAMQALAKALGVEGVARGLYHFA